LALQKDISVHFQLHWSTKTRENDDDGDAAAAAEEEEEEEEAGKTGFKNKLKIDSK